MSTLKVDTIKNVVESKTISVANLVDSTALSASGGSAAVGFIQAGTGAVARTVQSKMREIVSVKDFGAVGDGVTDDTAAIQAAIDAVPIGGTLHFNLNGTILIDTLTTVKVESDLGSNYLYGGIIVNKAIKIIGDKTCKLKIKPFSSAWSSQAVGDSICAVLVTASNVHIDGLNIDCNGNNHYEVSGGDKWWESGPTLKRPPCGISVSVARYQENVENCLIENCLIENPLAGISFIGNAVDSSRAEFLSGKLTTGVVKNCKSINNTIKFSRGNSILFNMGVDGCSSSFDTFINPMYHCVRMYSRAINCIASGSASFINVDQILNKYNTTDNGYWRTTDTTSAEFKIARSGFHIGGQDSYSVTYGYSVVNCGFINCRFIKNAPTSYSYATYYTTSSVYLAGYSITTLKNCYVINNASIGAQYGLVLYYDGISPADTHGIVIKGNAVIASLSYDIYINGAKNASVCNNDISVNSAISYYSAYIINLQNSVFSNNRFNGSPISTTYAIVMQGNLTNTTIKNNEFGSGFLRIRRYVQTSGTPSVPYPGRVYALANSAVISSGALSNSWVAAYSSPASGQDNILRVNEDRSITLQLRVSGETASATTVATLIYPFVPQDDIGFIATDINTGASYWGRVLLNGQIQIQLPTYPSPSLTKLYAEVTYSIFN